MEKITHLFRMNNGLSVYQDRAGKKCIGMTIPGNTSGVSRLRGSLYAIGSSMLAKLIRVKRKLKTISPLVFNHRLRRVYPMAASTPPNRLADKILIEETTTEKSASLIL